MIRVKVVEISCYSVKTVEDFRYKYVQNICPFSGRGGPTCDNGGECIL